MLCWSKNKYCEANQTGHFFVSCLRIECKMQQILGEEYACINTKRWLNFLLTLEHVTQ